MKNLNHFTKDPYHLTSIAHLHNRLIIQQLLISYYYSISSVYTKHVKIKSKKTIRSGGFFKISSTLFSHLYFMYAIDVFIKYNLQNVKRYLFEKKKKLIIKLQEKEKYLLKPQSKLQRREMIMEKYRLCSYKGLQLCSLKLILIALIQFNSVV